MRSTGYQRGTTNPGLYARSETGTPVKAGKPLSGQPGEKAKQAQAQKEFDEYLQKQRATKRAAIVLNPRSRRSHQAQHQCARPARRQDLGGLGWCVRRQNLGGARYRGRRIGRALMGSIRDIHNVWRDNLVPASFRGAVFHVESSSRASGRRTVLHQYPKRNSTLCRGHGPRGGAVEFHRLSDPARQGHWRQSAIADRVA